MRKSRGVYFLILWVSLSLFCIGFVITVAFQNGIYFAETQASLENNMLLSFEAAMDDLNILCDGADLLGARLIKGNAALIEASTMSNKVEVRSLAISFIPKFGIFHNATMPGPGAFSGLYFKASGYMITHIGTDSPADLSPLFSDFGLTDSDLHRLTEVSGKSVLCLMVSSNEELLMGTRLFMSKEIYPGIVLITGTIRDSAKVFIQPYTFMDVSPLMFLLSDGGEVLAAMDKNGFTDSYLLPHYEAWSGERIVFNENSYYAYYGEVDGWGLKLLVLFPDRLNTGLSGILARFLVPFTIFLSLVGIGFAYFVASILYRPILKLVRKSPDTLEKTSLVREFDMVEHALDQLKSSNQLYREQLDEKERILVDHIVLQLMLDSTKNFEDWAQILIRAGFPMHSEQYSVVLFHMHEAVNGMLPDEVSTALIEITKEELAHAGYAPWLCWDGSVLICVAGQTGLPQKTLSECFEGIRLALEQIRSGINLAATISDIHMSLSKLDQAYAEASTVIIKVGVASQYNSLLPNGAMSCNQFLQTIVQMSSCLQTNNFEEGIRILKQLEGLFMGNLPPSVLLSRQQLLHTIIDASLLSLSANEDIHEDAVSQLTMTLTLKKDKAIPEDVINALVYALVQLEKEADPNKNVLREIAAYVDEHFSDNQLSSASIATQFGLSASKLCILFNRSFQMGFLDYLHMRRIEKAIDLIQNTNESITTIMKKVGYSSKDTMIRAFKRYKGVTPKWYRASEEH